MHVRQKLLGTLGATAALAIALTGDAVAQEGEETSRAIARMANSGGAPVGTVEVFSAPSGVVIEVLLTGLTPGEHAIHLHETGSCAPDFDAAGDHVAPEGKEHGFRNPDGPHAGDLPNVFVDVEGTASAHFFNDRVTLDGGETSLLAGDGTAVIVHELSDLYGEDAGAGERMACGVLEPRI